MLHLNYLRTWDIFEPPLQMKDNKWAEVCTLYQQLYLKNCPFLHCISRYKHRCVLAPCMLFWHLIGQTSSCSNMRHKFQYTHNKQIKFCFTRHYRPAQLGTDNYYYCNDMVTVLQWPAIIDIANQPGPQVSWTVSWGLR